MGHGDIIVPMTVCNVYNSFVDINPTDPLSDTMLYKCLVICIRCVDQMYGWFVIIGIPSYPYACLI